MNPELFEDSLIRHLTTVPGSARTKEEAEGRMAATVPRGGARRGSAAGLSAAAAAAATRRSLHGCRNPSPRAPSTPSLSPKALPKRRS